MPSGTSHRHPAPPLPQFPYRPLRIMVLERGANFRGAAGPARGRSGRLMTENPNETSRKSRRFFASAAQHFVPGWRGRPWPLVPRAETAHRRGEAGRLWRTGVGQRHGFGRFWVCQCTARMLHHLMDKEKLKFYFFICVQSWLLSALRVSRLSIYLLDYFGIVLLLIIVLRRSETLPVHLLH